MDAASPRYSALASETRRVTCSKRWMARQVLASDSTQSNYCERRAYRESLAMMTTLRCSPFWWAFRTASRAEDPAVRSCCRTESRQRLPVRARLRVHDGHRRGGPQNAAEGFIALLEQQVNGRLLNDLAPLSVRLASGRQTKIHYEQERLPWISSSAGFLRNDEEPEDRSEQNASGRSPARAELSCDPDHDRPRRLLGAPLSAGTEGIAAALSPAPVARRP